MRISFDVDGVFADFTSSIVRRANRMWPGKFPYGYGGQKRWNFADVLTTRGWEEVWAQCQNTPDFWCELRPFLNEVKAVKAYLDSFGGAAWPVETFFITSRRTPKTAGAFTAEQQTYYWLSCVGLGTYAKDHIIVTANPDGKADAVRRLGIDFHIDDLDANVIACDKVPGHHSFLLDRPWNQNAGEQDINRVSMQRFLEVVHSNINWINAKRLANWQNAGRAA